NAVPRPAEPARQTWCAPETPSLRLAECAMGQPTEDTPMPLDPQARAILDQFAAMNVPPLHQMPVAQARELMLGTVALGGPPEAVAGSRTGACPGPPAPSP